ncbi:MAG TPA: hypothetical protein VMZ91_09340 [Candidatus Paceibacterota bacterium]|nr:hypothetical protein [Candidatus Paceibacterota bacterium]
MKLKSDKKLKVKRLPKMPKSYLDYINYVRKKAKAHGIEVFFSKNKTVFDSDEDTVGTGGFFCNDELKRIATGTNNPLELWFIIFIHESCHMEQWIENEEWFSSKVDDYSKFFDWLNGEKATKQELKKSIQAIIDIEKDCEIRSVEKIKKYKFKNIDAKEYIQKANCYLFLYTFMLKRRKWYNHVYGNEKCWKSCPSTFKKDYSKLSARLNKAFETVADKIDLESKK